VTQLYIPTFFKHNDEDRITRIVQTQYRIHQRVVLQLNVVVLLFAVCTSCICFKCLKNKMNATPIDKRAYSGVLLYFFQFQYTEWAKTGPLRLLARIFKTTELICKVFGRFQCRFVHVKNLFSSTL